MFCKIWDCSNFYKMSPNTRKGVSGPQCRSVFAYVGMLMWIMWKTLACLLVCVHVNTTIFFSISISLKKTFFIINQIIIKLSTYPHTQTHTVQTRRSLLKHSAVTIATWGIRKWLCSWPHILASEIRLALGYSTARWLPLSTLCGNSRTLFTVCPSVWHHSKTLPDQFPPVCQLSDLMSVATVIQSSKCVFSIWVCRVWHLDKWQDYFKESLFVFSWSHVRPPESCYSVQWTNSRLFCVVKKSSMFNK